MADLVLQMANNILIGLGAVAIMVIGIVLYWPGQSEKCAAWLRARAVYRCQIKKERDRLQKDRAELTRQLLEQWRPTKAQKQAGECATAGA